MNDIDYSANLTTSFRIPSSRSVVPRESKAMILAATSCFVSFQTPIHSQTHNLFPRLKVFAALNSSARQGKRLCECFDLHRELVPYGAAWSWQKSIYREKKGLIDDDEECPDSVIILQHLPVYTLGTGSSEEFLNFQVKEAPFDVFRTERGGEVTYHGPGQLVMYPIMNLRNHKMDLHWYLRMLEEVVIRVLSNTFSIKASRVEGLTGVWVGDEKLAAVGIRVSQWIAYHGLALNVTTDLAPFKWIVPCGIRNRRVGSIKGMLQENRDSNMLHESDDSQLIDITHKSLLKEFAEIFQVEVHYKSITKLDFLDTKP